MNPYILSCSSTADLTEQHFQDRNIHYICFHFSVDGRNYFDDLGKSIPFDHFYDLMRSGAETKTSQINAEEYIEYFTPFLEQGQDILHVALSSGISGTYQSACIARDELSSQFPNRKIYIVDSLCASSGFGLLMDKLADLRDGGMGIDELNAWATAHRTEVMHWLFSTDLSSYVRGGRITKTAGWVGTVLNLCPLIKVDQESRLVPQIKARGKKAAIHKIVEQMKLYAMNGTDYNGKCYISQSDCYEDAAAVAKRIKETFPHLDGEVEINSIGTTIGSHTGPGTVALFFWGEKR